MFILWISLITFIVISTVVYTIARYYNKYLLLSFVQPLTTLLFVIMASIGTFKYGIHHNYTMLIMLALTFALAGDCNLIILEKNRHFLLAVFYYWLGLITYSITFTIYLGFTSKSLITLIILIPITLLTIKKYFLKGLKEDNMLLPILIYCLTWCYLLSITLTIFFDNSTLLNSGQKLLILAGTGLYFLGDLNLSFHKFNDATKQKPYWLGALLYCIGQMLIALSASFFTIFNN